MNEKPVVHLSTGTFEFKPLSETKQELIRASVRKEFAAAGKIVERPTYEFETFGGSKVQEPHDETTEKTPEEERAWEVYVKASSEMRAEANQRISKAILMGIQAELPEDNEWIEMQRFIGVEIDEKNISKLDLRHHYLTTEIVVTAEDYLELIETQAKTVYSGLIDKETLQGLISGFRHKLSRNEP